MTSCANGPLPLDDLLELEECWNAGQFFYQPEVFFSRQLWEKAGGSVDETAFYSMDYELWLGFAAAGAVLHVIGRPLAIFRIHPEQKTPVPERFQNELVRVRDAFLARTGRPAWVPRPQPRCKQRLRIALLNDFGFQYGAGIAHQRIAQACANAGHEVYAIALHTGGEAREVLTADVLRTLEERPPDLVLLGNLHAAAVDPGLPGLLAARWPTAVILHDFWPLTGRCPYPGDCTKYITGCDHTCPTASEYPVLPPEEIAEAFRVKQRVYATPRPPALLAVSCWGQKMALKLLHRTCELPTVSAKAASVGRLGLGLALDVFRPRDKAVCRELLGLPPEAFIVLASACSIKDTRKGMKHLAQALARLRLRDLVLVLVGVADCEDWPGVPDVRTLGFVHEPGRLALAYGAADVFVGPSLAETFGQVFMEAAACGTPSVGYAVSGVCDAILDGVSGRLAPWVHPAALASSLEEIYTQPHWRRNLGQWARLHAENEWSYATLYHRLGSALRAVGLATAIGLSRKTTLAPHTVPLTGLHWLEPATEGWLPVSGFGHWEGPYPQWALPLCIWSWGPHSILNVTAAQDGPHLLVIRCLNYERGQRLRVSCEGQEVLEQDIPVSASNTEVITLQMSLPLHLGKNRLDWFTWRWSRGGEQEPRRALLILGIHACPTSAGHTGLGAAAVPERRAS